MSSKASKRDSSEVSDYVAVEDFKQTVAEKGVINHRPPLPLIPDKSLLDIEKKAHEFTLKVSTRTEDKQNVYKKKCHLFSVGTTEDALKWREQLLFIIKNKPCETVTSKFNLTETLLEGE